MQTKNDWWSELLMLQTSYYARKGHRNLFASTTALLHTHFEYLFFWDTFQAHCYFFQESLGRQLDASTWFVIV